MENIEYKIWTKFYQEFANKLLEYKDDRKKLIEIIKDVYTNTNIKLPTLELNNELIDIDPFTTFGLFNKGITNANRVLIISEFVKMLSINLEVPTNFDGIPILNNMAATYYYFIDGREVNDIDNLWKLFEIAINYADNQTEDNKNIFIEAYDLVLKQKGAKWNITFALYWIRPYFYINLDGVNRAFINDENNGLHDILKVFPNLVKNKVPNGSSYLDICDKCIELINTNNYEFKNLPEMSAYSWINKTNQTNTDVEWEPLNYSPNITIETWIELLNDSSIFNKESLELITKYSSLNNEATCSELSKKFGKHVSYYSLIATKLAKRIISKTNCNIYKDNDGKDRYWPILFLGKETNKQGSFIWRLRDELIEAIEYVDLSNIHIYVNDEEQSYSNQEKKYWIYSPGEQAKYWDDFYENNIMGIGWDDLNNLEQYISQKEIKEKLREITNTNSNFLNDSAATWQFTNLMNIGDVVFVKKGRSVVLGRGVVESNYIYDETRSDFKNIRKMKWTHIGEFKHPGKAVVKTLTDITPYIDYIEKLELLFSDDNEIIEDEKVIIYPSYSKEDFLSEVYMSNDNYNTLKTLLLRKKNIILQGAPGVGKTFAAKRLAYSLMNEKDTSRVEMIQFHQSYSYEDFIMGFRPNEEGFKLHYGAFYKFCKKAMEDNERDYFFIIDEINRGNLSKIFGELFMLIEHDKRDEKNSIKLLYANELFYIPSNIHIIGMMNTADRSLAMLDYALRRRFAFFEIQPSFDSELFKQYQKDIANPKFDKLIEVIKQLNIAIKEDLSLGAGFRIGHSYFVKAEDDIIDDLWINTVINYEVIPLIQEYWFDETSKLEEWIDRLNMVIS